VIAFAEISIGTRPLSSAPGFGDRGMVIDPAGSVPAEQRRPRRATAAAVLRRAAECHAAEEATERLEVVNDDLPQLNHIGRNPRQV
jgi:hypothetical protein